MKKILLLSDTHSYIDNRILYYVQQADQVWHAGDIGDMSVLDSIEKIRPLRVVYGNIDDLNARNSLPLDAFFKVEDITIFMTHIGGYPPKYNARVKKILEEKRPKLCICGHSHILKVKFDSNLGCLHMNPGAVGRFGFHKVRTMLRFTIDKDKIKNLEVLELGKR